MWRKVLIVVAAGALAFPSGGSADTFNVTKLTDDGGACTIGDCSLREAVLAANGNAEIDEIVLGPGPHNLTFNGAGEQAAATGDLDVTQTVTIRGAGAGATTIDANELDRVFDLPNNTFADLTLQGLRVLDGNAGAENGGGVRTDTNSDVTVEDVIFESNLADIGGAIFASLNFPRVVVRRSTFIGNSAQEGGALQNSGSARLSVADSFFSGNQSTGDGGAISNRDNGSATVVDSTFSGNSAVGGSGDGAGISTQNESSFVMKRGVVSANTAASGGGGLFIQNNSLATIIDSTVSGNRALDTGPGAGGGGLFIQNDTYTRITGTTISGNRTEENGGGITFDGNPRVVVDNSTVSGNSARLLGGGIHADIFGDLTLDAVTIASNSAGTGGGLHNESDPTDSRFALRRTLIAGNSGTNCAGTSLVSLGNNLSSVAGQCNLGAAGDLGGVNAGLAPLAANGGPTRTHALLAASAARDAGGSCGGFDQRGVTRPLGAACDIGAFEASPNLAAAAPAAAPDRTRPSVTRLGLSPKRFRARRRVRLSLRLSEAARITFTVERATSGRRRGRRCVKRTRSNRNARRCTRYVTLRGSFARSGKAGANSFRLVLRLRGRRLKPAAYRIVASARDAAGNRAVTKRAKFRVVR